jgi:YgiT-type zinc finger domain-containing protein
MALIKCPQCGKETARKSTRVTVGEWTGKGKGQTYLDIEGGYCPDCEIVYWADGQIKSVRN